MKKVLLSMAVALLAVTIAPSCQKEKVTTAPDSVALYTHPGEPVSGEAGTKAVTISATCDWTVASRADWIVVSPESGEKGIREVILTYTENTGAAQRSGGVVFTARGGYSETYVLTQNPKQ
jgi:hypothetical protein